MLSAIARRSSALPIARASWAKHSFAKYSSSHVDEPAKIIADKLLQASKSGDWKLALGTFQHLVSTFPQSVEQRHANLVLRACAAHGRHREAKKVLHTMQRFGLEAPTDEEKVTNSSLESKALMSIALIENGKGHDALEQMHKHALDALATATSDQEKDEIREMLNGLAYKPIIHALKKPNDWKLTLTALHHMQEFGLPISLRGYRMLFLSLSQGRQTEKLVDVVRQLLRLRGDVLDVATYTVMIQTLSARGEHSIVQEVIDHINLTKGEDWMQTSTNTTFYNTLLRAKMLSGEMDYCIARLNEMNSHENLKPDAFSYTTCILGYLNLDKPYPIFKLYKEMLRQNITPSILTLALVLRAIKIVPRQRKLVPAILESLEDIPLENANFVHTIIDALEELREFEASQLIFHRAMREFILVNWQKGLYSINLHSFSKGSAKAAVDFTLNTIADQPSSIIKAELQDLKIITGKGQGSREYMKPVLKPEIGRMLLKHFRLISFTPAQNEGSLVVKKEHIQEWIDKRNRKDD